MPVRSSRFLPAMLALGLVLGVPVIAPPAAHACGGFFCQTQPVDQAGERILFVHDGQSVTAHVQIQFTGTAQKFAWVVPVPTEPTLGVGADALFTALRAATRPRFQLNMRNEGDCFSDRMMSPGATSARADAGGAEGVKVVAEAAVGPYDTATLQANDPQALRTWLRDNGYDIPASLDPLLDPYVAGKFYFVALKLQKNRATGDLQPIVLKYKSTKPGIPIRLTAIAATPDMDVYAWVLGKHRAIPENYRHAVINETRIDWLNGGSNYRSVVTQAIDEAGGQAFVTDYAGPSSVVGTAPFDPSRFDLAKLRALSNPVAFTRAVIEGGYFQPVQAAGAPIRPMPGVELSDPLLSFLRRHVPKPPSLAELDDATYYGDIAAHAQAIDDAQLTVKAEAAADELDETVVKPYAEIREMFQRHPYLTQLYSTLSPSEMTVDPTFLFNPDLPGVDNVHTAEGVRECGPNMSFFEAPVRITLKDGTTFTVAQRATPGQPVDMPASLRIEQLKAAGAPSVIRDNRQAINQVAGSAPALAPGAGGGYTAVPKTPRAAGPGMFGCFGNAAAPAPLQHGAGDGIALGAFLLGWWGWKRRRKGL